ncbi:MAG: fumarylacetoacetate hydrolase family protein [Aggregatilineales bacterium]
MKLLTYVENGNYKLGVLDQDGVIPVSIQADDFYRRGLDVLSDLEHMARDSTRSIKESDLTLGPVVPNPGKILCVGLNYRKHAGETKMTVPDYPLLFSKFNNALAASGEDVPVSADWAKIDYEAEMVVVIGKTAKNVSEGSALDYVLGYCNGNDLSERALQFRSSQWLIGKTPDKFMPIGPYLVTADELGDPQSLSIIGKLNDEVRQSGNTNFMIFSVAKIISYASQLMTLLPGDIISTGTPDGVILGIPGESKQWMKSGDSYTVEVGPLGRLTNRIIVQR